jgi:PIN domain nuclease of toxin-antitoxin system
LRLLLDTHAFVWWLDGSRRLSSRARRAIDNKSNEVFVSAASAWEITTKARLGKLPAALDVATDVAGSIADQGFRGLDITVVHGQRAGDLAGAHSDPFDRMLIAQALTEGMTVVSADEIFDSYGVR